jgi:serine O-acetyltransferase
MSSCIRKSTSARAAASAARFSRRVEAVVASDLADPVLRHIDAGALPDRKAVIELVQLLRELLFPGYFGRQKLTGRTLAFYVGDLLGRVQDQLRTQVLRALRHQAGRHGQRLPRAERAAEGVVEAFLDAIPRLRALLATDVRAAYEGDPAAQDTDEVIFSYPGILAITVHRLAHELHRLEVPLIPRIMSEYAHALTGIDIHPGAEIGEAFFIDHGTGVVIGETTVIGRGVKLYQGVTLGALSTRAGQGLRGARRHPTLEDEVTVYSGASILGGDTVIGRGAVIASNVFITASVAPQVRVTRKQPELQYRNRRTPVVEGELAYDWVI